MFKSIRLLIKTLLISLLLIVIISADKKSDPIHKIKLPLFAPDSVWNKPIPKKAKVDKDSKGMINQVVRDIKNSRGAVLSVHEWSVTVFIADKNTPRVDVALKKNSWQRFSKIKNVPIPTHAVSDPEGDGHMCIIDLSERYVYEFWQARKQKDGSWFASWSNRISLDSNGIYPQGMSARGSGFSVIAGMIWPEEIARGSINHTLVMSIPSARKGGPIPPATESDGWKAGKAAIPEGARLQLDPDINLDDYNLTTYERIICECLQKYGAFVGDVSGSVELEAINPLSYSSDPYNGLFKDQWIFLPNIPWDKLRVLEMEKQIKNPVTKVMDESLYE